jgi:transcriptional regulator with XRE-family HTH domain
MLPFSQTVLLWRLRRGLTQEALARRSRISRPNLSAIERGRREVSLGTLRGLAAALGIRPGILVDGVAPEPAGGKPAALSREVIERVADAVALNRPVSEPAERAVAEALRVLLGHRMRAEQGRRGSPRTGLRETVSAWAGLKGLYGTAAIQMLADRVLERQRAHESQSH